MFGIEKDIITLTFHHDRDAVKTGIVDFIELAMMGVAPLLYSKRSSGSVHCHK